MGGGSDRAYRLHGQRHTRPARYCPYFSFMPTTGTAARRLASAWARPTGSRDSRSQSGGPGHAVYHYPGLVDVEMPQASGRRGSPAMPPFCLDAVRIDREAVRDVVRHEQNVQSVLRQLLVGVRVRAVLLAVSFLGRHPRAHILDRTRLVTPPAVGLELRNSKGCENPYDGHNCEQL